MNEKEEMKLSEETYLIYNYVNHTDDHTRFSREDNEQWYKKKQSNVLVNWECQNCTYINNPSIYECEICGERRLDRNLSLTSVFSVYDLAVDDLVDCADFRGIIYPSKVVKKNNNKITIHFRGWIDLFNEELDLSKKEDIKRIKLYESCKLNYGLSKYTVKMFSDERMKDFVKKFKDLEEPDLKSEYYIGREVYNRLNDVIYVYKIVKFDEINNTLTVRCGNEVLSGIPLTSVDLEISKDDIKNNKNLMMIRGDNSHNDSNNGIVINVTRRVLKEESFIDKITNSFISDMNRTTIYCNSDIETDFYNCIEL